MRVVSEAARRYARALYEVCDGQETRANVLAQLRELALAIDSEPEITAYFHSNTVGAAQKAKSITASLEPKVQLPILKSFLGVLAERNRLGLVAEISESFLRLNDEANGVVRGTVRSVESLGPDERKSIQERISKSTGKQVILDYREDKSLIGGLVAQVGSLTFDDSIDLHLKKMNDELKKRGH
jgi:F-type H+-transporting ATPase subunit delta